MGIPDLFDSYEADDYDDQPSYTKECLTCGKAGLVWEHLSIGWRLVEKSGMLHKCKPKTIAPLNLDKEF